MIVTELVIRSPEIGDKSGYCCVCGKETNNGFDLPFSNSFTGYSYLKNGGVTCEYCYHFFRNQNYRKKSWFATEESVVFLKREEVLETLLREKPVPFFLYVTKSYQKQGWLDSLQRINFDNVHFYVSTDWLGSFLVNQSDVKTYHNLICRLRENKVSKSEIIRGELTMKNSRLAMEKGWYFLIESAKPFIRNPLWELLAYVSK